MPDSQIIFVYVSILLYMSVYFCICQYTSVYVSILLYIIVTSGARGSIGSRGQ